MTSPTPAPATLNDTPSGVRAHITLYGRRNAGKSSLINALTGQEVALVSPVAGTTTDPVAKAMELLPYGPVVITDTPGLDDDSPAIGADRVRRARSALSRTDLALLVTTSAWGIGTPEKTFLEEAKARRIPVAIAYNRSDETPPPPDQLAAAAEWGPVHTVSALTGDGIPALKTALARQLAAAPADPPLLRDLLRPGDTVVLVTPIDASAPKGRLILPQQQAIRDILDADAHCIVTKETGLATALSRLKNPPRLVVTDSQAFRRVAEIVPESVPLTSFSILFARHKGDLDTLAAGARAIQNLHDGDTILIAEGCTHHRQDDDIGTVKIPRWLQQKTGKRLEFVHTAGQGWPTDLTPYSLIIHCGACMLTRREMLSRISAATQAGIPIVNYGVLIAHLHDILPRSLAALTTHP